MSLYVKAISAVLTRDTDVFSNMDPYVVIIVGPQKQRSRTLNQAGKKPRWNEQFVFRPKAASMLVTVYDEDVMSDDVVGSVNIQLKKYLANPVAEEQNHTLSYKGKSAGTIKLNIRYQPPTQPINPNNNFAYNGYSNQQQNISNQQYNNPYAGWGNQQNQPNPYSQNNGWGNQQNQTNPYSQNNGWGNQNINNSVKNPQFQVQLMGGIMNNAQQAYQNNNNNNYQLQPSSSPNQMNAINAQLVGLIQPKQNQYNPSNQPQQQQNPNQIWSQILSANLPSNSSPNNNAWNNNNNVYGYQNNNGWGSNNGW